jgi:tRNA threonylcarbamoyladenosine biosynthesis protein TsaE
VADEHSEPQRFVTIADADEMRRLGRIWGGRWRAGDIVLLEGVLGAGKTTFVRGVIEALDWPAPVRSPTFGIAQVFDTDPPVLHADLYRVEDARGTGIEEYFGTHLCLIEWPERLGSLVDPDSCWLVRIEFEGIRRRVWVRRPLDDPEPDIPYITH